MDCYDKILTLFESLHAKNPTNEKIASRLFQLYLKNNDFQNMNKMCVKLEKNFGFKEYALYSIESTYLYS